MGEIIVKLTNIAIIIGMLILSSTGCTQSNQLGDKSKVTISDNTRKTVKKDIQVLEVKVDLKQQDKKDSNTTSYLQEEVKGGLDLGTKKTFNIDLKKGESLRIDTKIEYPITVMLKDNSTGEYVYNNTQTPKENSIFIDSVDNDGNYELMVDFNEIKKFNFSLYIVN